MRVNPADEVAEAGSPGIMSCTELREFWIDWDEGNLRVGKGDVAHEAEIMDWEIWDYYDVITAVSVTTKYDEGEWLFTKAEGKGFFISYHIKIFITVNNHIYSFN